MRNQINNIFNSIREIQGQFYTIIKGFKERNNKMVVGLVYDIMPVEILAAFDMVSLFLPSFLISDNKTSNSSMRGMQFNKIYDLIVVPHSCPDVDYYRGFNVPLYIFEIPSGFGETFDIKFRAEIEKFLNKIFSVKLKEINNKKLKECTERYNCLRRFVRGISFLRSKNHSIINSSDLFMLFQAAAVLPFDVMEYYLKNLSEQLGGLKVSADESKKIRTLAAGHFLKEPSVLDRIEDAGCLIVEDDMDRGRRFFDFSFNISSPDLCDEIFQAYSFKLFPSFVRPVKERYELFYKMLKKHNIDLVIFLKDDHDNSAGKQVDLLRKKLMRLSVDPITVTYDNAYAAIKEYINKSLHIQQ